jgi:hypothetical protein
MAHHKRISEGKDAAIVARLLETPHASLVAREDGEVSYATVWRIADREGIELTEGRKAKGYKRLSPQRRAAVMAELCARPAATQAEIAHATGVSRPTVTRIEGGRRRHRKLAAAAAD